MLKLVLTAPIATYAEPDWLVIGLSEGDRLPGAEDLAEIPTVLEFSDLIAQSQWIAVVHPELRERFFESRPALSSEMAARPSAAIVLVGWRPAPLKEAKTDGRITSFLCSAEVFGGALRWAPEGPFRLRQLCFYVLDAIINGRVMVDRLVVRQLPLSPDALPSRESMPQTAVIMPHRGTVRHLETALRFLQHNVGPHTSVRVGLDSEDWTNILNCSQGGRRSSSSRPARRLWDRT